MGNQKGPKGVEKNSKNDSKEVQNRTMWMDDAIWLFYVIIFCRLLQVFASCMSSHYLTQNDSDLVFKFYANVGTC